MRHTEVILSKSADATSGYTVVKETPRWARNLVITLYGDEDTDSTQTSFDFDAFHCSLYPGVTNGGAAVTIATSTAGSSTQSEVQTLTFNGNASLVPPAYLGPYGSFALTFSDITTTAYISCMPGGGYPSAKQVQDACNEAFARGGYNDSISVSAVGVPATTASVTQTIYTITYAQGAHFGLANVAAVTADTTGLMLAVPDTATNFFDWDGITAQTTQSTSEYSVIQIGPGITGIANDDTAHFYSLNGVLPQFIAFKVTTDVTTDTACTYTYQVIGEYS
jgi:hypothetical protein